MSIAVAKVKAHREQIEKDYKVENGVIRSPGKFEGEPIYVAYFWLHVMPEDGPDDVQGDNCEIGVFTVLPEEREAFPELGDKTEVRVYEQDDGFVREDR